MVIDRLFNVLRSQLNDFIESKEEEWGFDPDNEESSIDAWLRRKEEEMEQRKKEREDRGFKSRRSRSGSGFKRKETSAEKEKKAFKNLEMEKTKDFSAIKKQYRKLVKKYHPDRQTDEKKRKTAEKITAKLNDSYAYLEKVYAD